MVSKDFERNLIFDIGLHAGYDTKFYLELGYNVVSVDANIELVKKSWLKFKKYEKHFSFYCTLLH